MSSKSHFHLRCDGQVSIQISSCESEGSTIQTPFALPKRPWKALGVSVAMDDFGTGYSSLGYLWRFPFDKLKIDQSFMIAFEQGEANIRQIIGTIVSLGHHMNLKVVTEGIETPEQAAMLQELGCDQLQGYLFGKPVAAERVAAELLTSISQRAGLSEGPADGMEASPLRVASL